MGSRTSQQQLRICSSWICWGFFVASVLGRQVEVKQGSVYVCCPCYSSGEKQFIYCLSVWLVAGAAIHAQVEVRMDSVLSDSLSYSASTLVAARNGVWQWQFSCVELDC